MSVFVLHEARHGDLCSLVHFCSTPTQSFSEGKDLEDTPPTPHPEGEK